VYPDRLERCWVSSPDFEESLAECDRVVWGQLDYNPNNGILAPGLFGLGIAFPERATDRYG
jgi:hypothetical protein